MHTIDTTWNNHEDPNREITIKILARRGILKRLNHLSKSAEWEEKIPAIEKWLGKICRGVIGFSAFYFIASLILR